MVVHDSPIRGRRQQPVAEYGRAYARDPEKWLRIRRERMAERRARGTQARRQARDDAKARTSRGFARAT